MQRSKLRPRRPEEDCFRALCDLVQSTFKRFHSAHFFAGVGAGSHEFVDVALNDGKLAFTKPSVGVATTGVRDADRGQIDG